VIRLAAAVALVAAMGVADIERAQQVARSRDSERAQFHSRYVFDLPGDTVTRLEVLTEFRRLVITTEEHLRIGDEMFSRGTRLAEAALTPTRGLTAFRCKLRFHPLNTYAEIPPYKLALGPALSPGASNESGALVPIETTAAGEFSVPFKDRSTGKTVKTLIGATLDGTLAASGIGQTLRPLGVVLEGREIARIRVDFTHLD
jgi:hypothetical protein